MRKHTKIFLTEMLLIILLCGYNNVLILAFMWVILHELSHIIIARVAGCKFFNMELHIFGARANLVDLEYVNDKQRLMIYLAGPVINIIIAIILYLLNLNIHSFFIETSVKLNIGLAIFNLLPAYPLDGSRIYEILLSKRIIYKRVQKIISICSYLVAGILLLLFTLIAIIFRKFNISLLLSVIIIVYITRKEVKRSMYITIGNIVKKRNKLIKNKYIENKTISVYYKHGLVNVLGLVERNRFNIFYILDDEMKLIHIMYEDELIVALKTYGNITLGEYVEIIHDK